MTAEFYLNDVVKVRQQFNDPYAAFAFCLLKPICEACRYPDGDDFDLLGVPGQEKETNDLFPKRVSGLIRRYLRLERRLHISRTSSSSHDLYDVPCSRCGVPFAPLESPWGVSVEETPYSYPRNVRKRGLKPAQRAKLLLLYDDQCFACKRPLTVETLTVDHVIPQANANRPLEESIYQDHPELDVDVYEWANLVPLCRHCNQDKEDKNPRVVQLVLDRLILPPSDHASYGMV